MLRLGCPGSLMSLHEPQFHATIDLCIILKCKIYLSCIMICDLINRHKLLWNECHFIRHSQGSGVWKIKFAILCLVKIMYSIQSRFPSSSNEVLCIIASSSWKKFSLFASSLFTLKIIYCRHNKLGLPWKSFLQRTSFRRFWDRRRSICKFPLRADGDTSDNFKTRISSKRCKHERRCNLAEEISYQLDRTLHRAGQASNRPNWKDLWDEAWLKSIMCPLEQWTERNSDRQFQTLNLPHAFQNTMWEKYPFHLKLWYKIP